MENKAVFLDRDGVLNKERGDYNFMLQDFIILPGVPEALRELKAAGFHLIVITNQSGISKGLFTREQMEECHRYFQEETNHIIDAFYYSPWHPTVSESLTRKPDSLMIEKAMARFKVDPAQSWFIGDRERDIEAGDKQNLQTIRLDLQADEQTIAHYTAESLYDALKHILG